MLKMEILHSLLALHDLAALPEGKIKKLLTFFADVFHNHKCTQFIGCLPAVISGIWSVKLCTNKILQFSVGGAG